MINRNISSNNKVNNTPYINNKTIKQTSSKQAPNLSLEKGQVVKGKVLSLADGKISLSLSDGQIISGSLKNNLGLSDKMEAYFQIEEYSNNTIVLKLLGEDSSTTTNNASKENVINNILSQNNLMTSENNYEIVNELLKHQMPVDKDTITYFIRQSHIHKDTPIDLLIRMNTLEIPITQESVAIFSDLLSSSDSLTSQFNSLIDSAINHITNPENILTADYFTSNLDLIKTFIPNLLENDTLIPNVPQNNVPENDSVDIPLSNPSNSKTDIPLDSLISYSNSSALQASLEDLITVFLDNYQDLDGKDFFLFTSNNIPQKTTLNSDINPEVQVTNQGDQPSQTFTSNEILSDIRTLIDTYLNHDPNPGLESPIKGLLTSTPYQNLVKSLFKAEYYPNIEILNNAESIEDYLINTKLELKRFGNIVKMFEEFSLNENNTEDYNYQSQDISKSSQNDLASLSKSFLKFNSDLSQINNQFDSMLELNKYIPFLHLPIKFMENKQEGELYVFAKKKKDPQALLDNIKVVLRLDMKHLGPLDVQISLNRTRVQTTFYTRDPENQSIITNNLNQLDKVLEEKGFIAQSKVLLAEEEKTSLNDLLKNPEEEKILLSYNFDTKI